MVLGFLILVISSIGAMETWEVLKHTDLSLIETRGIAEAGAKDLFKEKFPEKPEIVCAFMHETRETPFVAIILFKTSGRLLCMGTIIDQCHILSAKRCYDKTEVGDLFVLVGYFKAYWGRHSQVLPVRKIVRHEFEIALLKLGKDIRFTEFVQAVKLPTSFSRKFGFLKRYPPPYKTLGFPVDRYDVPGDPVSKNKIYRMIDEKDADFEQCKANYSKFTLDDSKLFCTLPNGSGDKPLCWGGWGGPVLKKMTKGFLLQVGMVVADNCSDETTGPLLAVRTDVFGDWIRGNSYRGHQAS